MKDVVVSFVYPFPHTTRVMSNFASPFQWVVRSSQFTGIKLLGILQKYTKEPLGPLSEIEIALTHRVCLTSYGLFVKWL